VAEYRPGPPRRGHGPGRRQQPHRLGPRLEQRGGTRSAGGARGEHVVDEYDPSRSALGPEHAAHRLAPRGRPAASLRSRVPEAPNERDGRYAQPGSDRPCERPGLVVAARRQPLSGQRNPRERARRPRDVGPGLGHRDPERIRDGAPPPELQAVDRATDRPVEAERRPRDRDRVRRTVPARSDGARRRRTASLAPRWREHHELRTARGAERPRSRTASRTPFGEQHVEQRERHAGGRYPALPTPGLTAAGCRAPPPSPCRVPSARPAVLRRSASTGTPSPCRVRSPRRTPARAPAADARRRTAST
jgi:hypothetical protein